MDDVPYNGSMMRILGLGAIGCVLLAGCGNADEKRADPDNVGAVSDVVPMSDGTSYLVTRMDDGTTDGRLCVWYVSGTRQTEVAYKLVSPILGDEAWPEITALADGTAILNVEGDLWRLVDGIAIKIRTSGKAKEGKPGGIGSDFSLWQKERADRKKFESELEDR